MNLHGILVFERMAAGSRLAVAARELGIDVRAARRDLRALEAEMGGDLVYRDGGVTPLGTELLPAAMRVSAAVARMSVDVIEVPALRLSLSPLYPFRLVETAIVEIRRLTPGLVVEILMGSECDVSRADVTVAPQLPNGRAGALTRSLGRLPVALVAAPSYHQDPHGLDLLTDLRRRPFLDALAAVHPLFPGSGRSRLSRVVASDDPVLIADLAVAGNGVARLPRWSVAELIARGRLREVIDHRQLVPLPFAAVYQRQAGRLPTVRAFVAVLMKLSAGAFAA